MRSISSLNVELVSRRLLKMLIAAVSLHKRKCQARIQISFCYYHRSILYCHVIMAKLNDSNTQHIQLFRSLLLEALQAGLFLSETAGWRPHHSGEILYFADRAFGVERPAVLVLTPEITSAILAES